MDEDSPWQILHLIWILPVLAILGFVVVLVGSLLIGAIASILYLMAVIIGMA